MVSDVEFWYLVWYHIVKKNSHPFLQLELIVYFKNQEMALNFETFSSDVYKT